MTLRRRTLLAALASTFAGRGAINRGAAAAPAPAEPVPTPPAPQSLALAAAPVPGTGRLSYDGSLSGPAVRVRRGTVLAVTLANRCAAPTSLQWHGLRGMAAPSDILEGVAQVAPGASLTATLRAAESGLSWFHPAARIGESGQASAGLRGILIVEEDNPPVVDLDLLLVIEDGENGPALRVNGLPAPGSGTLVTGGRLRLRLLNATASRLLPVRLEGARFGVIAIDGQPSELFPPLADTVPLGPGARFELMADAPRTADARIVVGLRLPPGGAGAAPAAEPLYELRVLGAPRPALPPIAPLPPNPALPSAIPLERSVRPRLTIEPVAAPPPGKPRWRLNGVAAAGSPAKPLFTVKAGGAVTLLLDNRAAEPLPMRVHGQAMRLLHPRDDGWEPYWRDSVILPPGTVTPVAFVPDAPGRWLIDSAVASEAAAGLQSFFTVTGGAT